MKILAVGDFHGELSSKLKRKILRYDFDLIISNGDYCGQQGLSEILFKYYYGKHESERKKIPKKIQINFNLLEKKSVYNGVRVLRNLRKIKKPFFGVRGNWDPTPWTADVGYWEIAPKWQLKKLNSVLQKDFEFIDFRVKDLGSFVLVGGTSSSYPGMLRKNMVKRIMQKWKMGRKEAEDYVYRIKRDTKWRTKKFVSAFQRAKKLNKPIVFLTHNSPYNTKLDLIKSKRAHKLARGAHYGSYLERQMILRFRPDLVVCGHIHENFGKDKLGRSLIVNIGSAHEGNFVVIDFNEKRKKFDLKFIK